MTSTFLENITFSSMQTWRLDGPDAVVKVVRTADVGHFTRARAAKGYVTQARFLKGLNAFQIEARLGLRPNSLTAGAYVLYFARLPTFYEVVHRFTADMPDGKIYDDDMHESHLEARSATGISGSDIVEFYPPGSARVLQWKLVSPVPLSGAAKQVTAAMPFRP